jgi:hypothetical protein
VSGIGAHAEVAWAACFADGVGRKSAFLVELVVPLISSGLRFLAIEVLQPIRCEWNDLNAALAWHYRAGIRLDVKAVSLQKPTMGGWGGVPQFTASRLCVYFLQLVNFSRFPRIADRPIAKANY